jgi:thymidine kinase
MSLDIVIGPMFAGKSSRILSIESRYASLGLRVLILKHASDNRFGYHDDVITHDLRRVPCRRLLVLNEVEDETLARFDVVIVDEAHFFPGLVEFVTRIVEHHRKVLFLVGLDGDSNRRPFGELLECIPLADRVERITAFCRRCANGTPGLFSHRTHGPHDQQVIVGGAGLYETLCRGCYLRQEAGDPPRRMGEA